ncbi:MAG: chromosomal replication initiator protein DnaA [Bacteroidetes bacterium]|nr:MAG: chromosomal replication initiator protein DnaA [Bacteroidota bacterium]
MISIAHTDISDGSGPLSEQLDASWGEVLSLIQPQINSQSFKTWFEPIKPVRYENGELMVNVPSQFFFEWLEEHYHGLVAGALQKVFGRSVKVTYNVTPVDEPLPSVVVSAAEIGQKANEALQARIEPAESVRPLEYDKTNLNRRYTFANFIKGESNQLARAAAMAVANNPGGTSFNPLVLYGGTGLGKTHLMQAIGNYALEHGKAKRVMYISSEKFTIEFIDAIRGDRTNEFSNFYRSMDILIVDDIQFFSGKEKTQDSFFHTFNSLHQLGKQIILSSDRPPKELQGLDDRLISRFQWGLTADIQPPDLETRTAILRKKCEDESVNIPDQVLDFVAANVTSNVRELEGCYTSLLFKASLEGKEVDIDLAREVLRSIVNDVKSPLSVEEIQRIVSEFYDLPSDLLRAKTRKQEVVIARQVAMYLAKELTNCSLKTIGLNFGGRDHSTVIHAYQTVEEQLKIDPKFRTSMEQVRRKIEILSR